MPGAVSSIDAGLFFYRPHLSEIARSPTKMAEFLACGVPCVSNSGVGDVEKILEENSVGVAIGLEEKNTIEKGVKKLLNLLSESNLPERCRKTAEQLFSLEGGVASYHHIYQSFKSDNR
jgi:glycosyltransferase involved in cell wall biosynthesis